MAISGFKIKSATNDPDTLRIHISKGKVGGTFSVVSFVDKDTKQHVSFIPSFNLSGYGSTIEKANEMLKASIEYYFETLLTMSAKSIHSELAKYGWAQKKLNNKEFSKAYVDIEGQLKNFNAEENTIERRTLQAA